MQKKFSYQDYVNDERFLKEYNAYQKKYAETMRESDKVIIEIVREMLSKYDGTDMPKLLDIGCSTGNFLLHLKQLIPKCKLFGGDLAQSSLEICRDNKELSGVQFREMDILDLPQAAFDIITANAVLYMFDAKQLQAAAHSLFRSLRSQGEVVIFDFAHPFLQEIEVIEKTDSHPNGLRLCLRSESAIRETFKKAGFSAIEFRPFKLPFDLPRPDSDRDIITYTVSSQSGDRLAFRGTLYQPWCHMVAYKSCGSQTDGTTPS